MTSGSGAAGGEWARSTAFYLAIVMLAALPGLSSTGVLGIEAMIADTTETMLESGEWLVSKLYGEVHTYKPPLVYWLTALSFQLGGKSEFTLRLPAAVSTIVMGLAILWLVGRATRPRTGALAALAATTNGLYLQEMKQGEFDPVLAAGVGIAVAAACHNLSVEPRRRSPWIWLLCYLALAVGFLAKGVPAIMAFAPGLLVAAVVTRQTRELFRWDHLLAAGLFGAIASAYAWGLWAEIGSAAFAQPLDEAGNRGFEWTLEALGRTVAKPGIIWAAFLPWSLVTLWGWRSSPGEERIGAVGRSFLAAGILTFMAVPTHETRYYLPLAASVGIVAACALERLAARPSRLALRLALGVAVIAAALCVVLGLGGETTTAGRIVLVLTGLAVLGAAVVLGRSELRYKVAGLLLVAAVGFWSAETWVMRPKRALTRDLRPVVREFAPVLPEGETLWAFGEADPVGKFGSLYYYLGVNVRTIRPEHELPAPGSYVMVTTRQLEGIAAPFAPGLETVLRVEHPWRTFLLCRVVPEERRVYSSGSSNR